jgi:hypothetical protein
VSLQTELLSLSLLRLRGWAWTGGAASLIRPRGRRCRWLAATVVMVMQGHLRPVSSARRVKASQTLALRESQIGRYHAATPPTLHHYALLGPNNPNFTGIYTFWFSLLLLMPQKIVAIQSLHYLTLAICIPPAVSLFSSRRALSFYGGPANVNFVISWHELAGQSAINPELSIDGIYSGGARLATSPTLNALDVSDPGRRWVIAAMWLVASLAE